MITPLPGSSSFSLLYSSEILHFHDYVEVETQFNNNIFFPFTCRYIEKSSVLLLITFVFYIFYFFIVKIIRENCFHADCFIHQICKKHLLKTWFCVLSLASLEKEWFNVSWYPRRRGGGRIWAGSNISDYLLQGLKGPQGVSIDLSLRLIASYPITCISFFFH